MSYQFGWRQQGYNKWQCDGFSKASLFVEKSFFHLFSYTVTLFGPFTDGEQFTKNFYGTADSKREAMNTAEKIAIKGGR